MSISQKAKGVFFIHRPQHPSAPTDKDWSSLLLPVGCFAHCVKIVKKNLKENSDDKEGEVWCQLLQTL